MVDVNTVYTTVLYILNKEQRGYIPPAEFNSLATQVQKEIFDSYFPDGNQLNRANQQNIQNDTEFFNMYKDNAYKVSYFENDVVFNYDAVNEVWLSSATRPLYRIGEIISTYNANPNLESITDLVSKKDFTETTKSKLTTPTTQYPLCYLTNIANVSGNYLIALKISPLPNSVNANCVVAPTDPLWAFTTGTLGQYLYDLNNSINFQLDISEQTNLIIGILKYAGVIIRDPEIVQTATQEAAKVQQNEKA
jgi:hypothetical protein